MIEGKSRNSDLRSALFFPGGVARLEENRDIKAQ